MCRRMCPGRSRTCPTRGRGCVSSVRSPPVSAVSRPGRDRKRNNRKARDKRFLDGKGWVVNRKGSKKLINNISEFASSVYCTHRFMRKSRFSGKVSDRLYPRGKSKGSIETVRVNMCGYFSRVLTPVPIPRNQPKEVYGDFDLSTNLLSAEIRWTMRR